MTEKTIAFLVFCVRSIFADLPFLPITLPEVISPFSSHMIAVLAFRSLLSDIRTYVHFSGISRIRSFELCFETSSILKYYLKLTLCKIRI